MVFIGRSKLDVEDPEKYKYLEPLWELLRNTPEKGITSKELFEQTGLDEKKANMMVKEIMMVYQNGLVKLLSNPLNLMKAGDDGFYDKYFADNWAYDKMMLLATRVDTGNPNPMDGNPFMDVWKQRWVESKGM